MTKRTFDWQGVVYQSPEYYRLYRLANLDKQREYHRAYDSEMYKLHPKREQARRLRYANKYPERIKANRILNRAVKTGEIIKQACEVCEEPKTVAHHDDWSKPLVVKWLCEVHHKARHKQLLTLET